MADEQRLMLPYTPLFRGKPFWTVTGCDNGRIRLVSWGIEKREAPTLPRVIYLTSTSTIPAGLQIVRFFCTLGHFIAGYHQPTQQWYVGMPPALLSVDGISLVDESSFLIGSSTPHLNQVLRIQ
jgi:hypothetical protein